MRTVAGHRGGTLRGSTSKDDQATWSSTHAPSPRTRLDLHLHTVRSDGKHAATEVLARCARAGIDVVALTDHDHVGTVAPGVHTIEGRSVTVLAGAEISGVHDGREQHLLVYFSGEVPEAFRAFCVAQCQERAVRYQTARDRLEALGLHGVAPPDEAARDGLRALTRHHLARELVRLGHVAHLKDAFAQYLGDHAGHVPPLATQFVDAIAFARGQGGITSWAHPPLPRLHAALPALVAAGLHAIEGLRPRLTSADRRTYREAARRHGLVLTGGSDWHGWPGDGELGLFRIEAQEVAPFLEQLAA